MPPGTPTKTLDFRPAGEDFARFLADVRTAELPDEPMDPPGVELDETTGVPRHDGETMQTNVPGVN